MKNTKPILTGTTDHCQLELMGQSTNIQAAAVNFGNIPSVQVCTNMRRDNGTMKTTCSSGDFASGAAHGCDNPAEFLFSGVLVSSTNNKKFDGENFDEDNNFTRVIPLEGQFYEHVMNARGAQSMKPIIEHIPAGRVSRANHRSPSFRNKAFRFSALRLCFGVTFAVLPNLVGAQAAPFNSEPMCEREFVTQLHKEMGETPEHRPRLKAYLRGVEIAKKSVRRIDCAGIGEAVFLTPRVFVTNQHVFEKMIRHSDGTQRSQGRLDPKVCKFYSAEGFLEINMAVDKTIKPEFGGWPSTSEFRDSAVAATTQAMKDIEPMPVRSSKEVKKHRELLTATTYRNDPMRPWLKDCLSFGRCKTRLVDPRKDDESTAHYTTCHSAPGASGGAVFSIAEQPDGSYDIGIIGIMKAVIKGHIFTTAFNTIKKGESEDLQNIITIVVGFDGLFRNQAETVLRAAGEDSLDVISETAKAKYSISDRQK
jgi:hypothetical protein